MRFLKASHIFASTVALLAAGLLAVPAANAQGDYPNRPIKIIVPFNAGGGIDFTARSMTDLLAKELGQQVIVENMPGGGGSVATAFVARADPDGYTLLYHSTTGPAQAAVRDDLPYKWFEDIVPVAQVTEFASVLISSPALPAKTIKEFVDLVKANPGKYSYGSSGVGTAVHLATEIINDAAGLDIVHVPYTSTGVATPDLIAGRIALMFDGVPVRAKDINAGTVIGLAVTTAQRTPSLPDVPTLVESGIDVVIPYWTGLYAPKGTPEAIVNKISEAVQKAMSGKEIADKLLEVGTDAKGSSPADFAKLSKETFDTYHDLVVANPDLLKE